MRDVIRVTGFLFRLAVLPLVAVFSLKVLILAGAWTLQSLPEPIYAVTAGLVVLGVVVSAIWEAVISTRSAVTSRSSTPASGQATAYCNACGKLNWANSETCHYCDAGMTAAVG